jgi:hypothetical protein
MDANFNNEKLAISLDLKGDHGTIKLGYPNIKSIDYAQEWAQPTSNEMIVLKMCHAVLEEWLDGSISIKQETEQPLCIEIRFSINARH